MMGNRRKVRGGQSAQAMASILTLLVMFLSGCAMTPSAAHRGAPAAPLTSWTPQATATPIPPTRSLQQAWGSVSITRLPMGLPDDQVFLFANATTPDDQWLVGEVAPRDVTNRALTISLAGAVAHLLFASTTFTPYLALYNVHTQQVAHVRTLATPRSGVSNVATDGTWFVWQEITAPSGVSDGVIRVLNWRTGVYREYPQANLVSVAVDQGKAIWSQTSASASGPGSHGEVRFADLNSGQVSTEASGAWATTMSWPWVGWNVINDASGSGYLQFKNMLTGQTTQTASFAGQSNASVFGSLTLSGATASFTMYGSQVDEIADVSSGATIRTVYDNHKPGIGEPSTSGRLIAWSISNGPAIPLVWDGVERTLVTLPTTSAQDYVAWTGNHLLVWYDPEPTAQQQADAAQNLQPLSTICVVDTSTLPATPPA